MMHESWYNGFLSSGNLWTMWTWLTVAILAIAIGVFFFNRVNTSFKKK